MQQYLYKLLIAPMAQALSGKVMAIGLFLVGVGYLKTGFADRDAWRKRDFGKRLVLLAAVLFFALYVVSSYQAGLTKDDESLLSGAGDSISWDVRTRVLLLGPLELLLAVIEATMFLVLGIDELSSLSADSKIPSVSEKVARLFKLTCLWHGVVIIWWTLWIGSRYFDKWSVAQHALLGGLQGIAAFTWWSMCRRVPEESRGRQEWLAVAAYAGIICLLYALRMSFYMDMAVENESARMEAAVDAEVVEREEFVEAVAQEAAEAAKTAGP